MDHPKHNNHHDQEDQDEDEEDDTTYIPKVLLSKRKRKTTGPTSAASTTTTTAASPSLLKRKRTIVENEAAAAAGTSLEQQTPLLSSSRNSSSTTPELPTTAATTTTATATTTTAPTTTPTTTTAPTTTATTSPTSSTFPTSSLPFRKTLVEGEPGTLTGRPFRLYADGIFDMFHFGHAKALQQCKEAYPHTYLLVGCCSDTLTHALKGRTVMSDVERYESLRHCKWVDEVLEEAPWVLSDAFLDTHAIDFVCHDALPYGDASGDSEDGDVYAHIKKMGKFLETRRTEGISTSDLIIRIISEYDTFIRRNLTRGYSGKDMNVPFMKETAIKLDMALDKVTGNMRGSVDKIKEKTNKLAKEVVQDADQMIHKWFAQGEELQLKFIHLFSREGALRTTLRHRRRLIKDKLFRREIEQQSTTIPKP